MLKLLTYGFIYFCLVGCAPKTSIITTPSPDLPLPPAPDSTLRQAALSYPPLFSIAVQSKYFTTDKLNQLYIVTKSNEVIKYDANGKEVFKYNNNFLEGLSNIDATNPFNILLYYSDFLSVTTLDRTMSKTGEFNLSNLGLIRVNAIGSSNDNNIWLYDEVAFKLKKINRSGSVFRESIDLSLQLNYSPRPNFLIERENSVYLNDPDFGILVFNIFGQYESVLRLKGIDHFQVFDNQIIYKKGKEVFSYHLQTFHQKELSLPVELKKEEEVFIQKDRLFVRKADKVEVYNLEKENK
ncbi:MAG: hypothetical protein ACI8P3_000074 [Saprospiraceae bacterium]|jgi:hypothetical protein